MGLTMWVYMVVSWCWRELRLPAPDRSSGSQLETQIMNTNDTAYIYRRLRSLPRYMQRKIANIMLPFWYLDCLPVELWQIACNYSTCDETRECVDGTLANVANGVLQIA